MAPPLTGLNQPKPQSAFPLASTPPLFFKDIRGTLRGENNCARHRSKGTTPDTDEGKQHPRGFAEEKGSRRGVLLGEENLGHLQQRADCSPLGSAEKEPHKTQSRGENNRSHVNV